MAVYTVETRTICQQQYLTNHGSSDPAILQGLSIDTILANTASDVLPSNFVVWNGITPQVIKEAILKHYWMREIGAETVALWRHYLETKLQETMPWFVDLHTQLDNMANIFINNVTNSSESLKYGHEIQKSGTDTTTDSGTVTTDGANTTNSQVLTSDTPQNGLTDVIAGNYLSQANVGKDIMDVTNEETRNLSHAVQYGMKDTHGGTDLRTVLNQGFTGDKVKMLADYRAAHINIMQDIIKSVACCWMGIYG